MPELLADDVWMKPDDDKRFAYDEDRLDHRPPHVSPQRFPSGSMPLIRVRSALGQA